MKLNVFTTKSSVAILCVTIHRQSWLLCLIPRKLTNIILIIELLWHNSDHIQIIILKINENSVDSFITLSIKIMDTLQHRVKVKRKIINSRKLTNKSCIKRFYKSETCKYLLNNHKIKHLEKENYWIIHEKTRNLQIFYIIFFMFSRNYYSNWYAFILDMTDSGHNHMNM